MTLSITVGYTQDNECSGIDCKYVPFKELTITPAYTLESTGCPTSTIEYTVLDPNGSIVLNTTVTIDNTDPEDPSDLTASFTPLVQGNYTITAELTDCSDSVVFSDTLVVCSFLLIAQSTSALHTYTICNTSEDDYTFKVTDLEDVVISTYSNVDLGTNTTATIVVPSDGVYKITFYNEDDEVVQISIITDYTNILACLSSRIQPIICTDCGCIDTRCQDYCKERFELNRIIPLFTVLMIKANQEAMFNSIYTSLEAAKVIELATIDSLIDKLSNYCDSCGDSANTSSNITNSGGCGCGC